MRTRNWVAGLAAMTLALTACGSGDGEEDKSGGPESAEIRVWLNGTDTPQEARDYLKETFEAAHEGSTLVIEEQSWTGLVDKLTTSLSGSDSPDIVEVGNTQSVLDGDLDDFIAASLKKGVGAVVAAERE